jgi:hypothetical protein
MIFRAKNVEAGGIERSGNHIKHVIIGGKASYENNMLKRIWLELSMACGNIQGSH